MDNELLSNRSHDRGVNYKTMRMNRTQHQSPLPNNNPIDINLQTPVQNNVSSQKENSNLMMYLAVGGGILTLGVIGYLVYKNRKLNQDIEEIKSVNNQRAQMEFHSKSLPHVQKTQLPVNVPPKVQFVSVPTKQQENLMMEHVLSQDNKMYSDIYSEMEDMELDEIEADQQSHDNEDIEEDN